jgi:hypothetical protein
MRTRASLIIALIALMTMASSVPAAPAKVVWSGLIIAENREQPAPIPQELRGIEQTLKELFGYNQFEVIGQSRKTLKTGEEDWLAASKYFSLHVDAQGESESGYTIDLKLYKEKDLLLETNTKLSTESPLVVKGPLVGNGQLLLVLVADEENSPNESPSPKHRAHRRPGVVNAIRHFTHVVRGWLP